MLYLIIIQLDRLAKYIPGLLRLCKWIVSVFSPVCAVFTYAYAWIHRSCHEVFASVTERWESLEKLWIAGPSGHFTGIRSIMVNPFVAKTVNCVWTEALFCCEIVKKKKSSFQGYKSALQEDKRARDELDTNITAEIISMIKEKQL